MKIDGDDVLFESTGKKDYANCGILGINTSLHTHGGYDQGFPAHDDDLSQEEKIELADFMIALWTRYKNEAKA